MDEAIGTTFSLDLIALLSAPLAFTFFEWEDENGRPAADPHALLAAIREYSDRVTVFCQAGQIAVPPHSQLLYGYLEDSVCEVAAPKGGVFHPKVWLLRFVAAGEPVRYRLLCLSRNLTFDRCWDTVLLLDGELTSRRNAIARNHPLGDLVAALPRLAVGPLPPVAIERANRLADEVRRVRFDLPPGFEQIAFHALGLGRLNWPFETRIDRLLTVSPFLAPGALKKLTDSGGGGILVSRLESLEPLSRDDLAGFTDVRVMSYAAQPDAHSTVDGEPGALDQAELAATIATGSDPPAGTSLTGLHAKIYVADAGRNASIWTGSGNATNAAFECNVEFLVRLDGKKSHCGIDAFLATGNGAAVGFADLLEPYEPKEQGTPLDPVRVRLERAADKARRTLASARLELHVQPSDREDRYTVQLDVPDRVSLPSEASLRAWPTTLTEAGGACRVDLAAHPAARFDDLPIELITPFVAFDLSLN